MQRRARVLEVVGSDPWPGTCICIKLWSHMELSWVAANPAICRVDRVDVRQFQELRDLHRNEMVSRCV